MTVTATKLQASPTKLRDGSWGARVRGYPAQGDTIQITTKAGKTWTATAKKVLWTDGAVSIVATSSNDGTRTRKPARRGCITDGNCSSFGDSRSCGGHDCDGF